MRNEIALMGRIASISITQTAGGAGVLAQGFGFESIGNLKRRTLSGGGRNENESFSYDALDRLAQNTGSGLTNSPADTGSYVIDAAGNLSNKAGLALAYQSNSNRLCNIGASSCASVNVSYDASGNITSYTRPSSATIPGADGATITLAGYAAFNLPTSISKSGGSTPNASASFHYDAGYQRIRQLKWNAAGTQVDDILYVVPGGFEVHRDQNGNVTQAIATVSGAEGAVASVTTYFDPSSGQAIIGTQNGVSQSGNTATISGVNTVTRILLKDHLSSMVAEVVILGTPGAPTLGTVTVHGFGPWGNARNAGSPLNVDQRGFTGHEHLTELGIIHMNGRLYDPVLGRFLQADPIIQAPHNAQSHNRYSYVLNNPLSFSDPSGFSAWTKFRDTYFKPLIAIGVGWALGPWGLFAQQGGIFGALTGGVSIGVSAPSVIATTQAISSVMAGFAAGGIGGGNIQSALRGAFSAGLLIGLGETANSIASNFGPASDALVASAAIEHVSVNAQGVWAYADGAPIQFASSGYVTDAYGVGGMSEAPPRLFAPVEISARNTFVDRALGSYDRFVDWRESSAWFKPALEIGITIASMRGGGGGGAKLGPPNAQQWRLGSFKSETRWSNQLEKRGWTKEQISEAVAKGEKFPAENLVNKDNLATRFVHPETGRSVVIDNVTKEVIHVGGSGFKY